MRTLFTKEERVARARGEAEQINGNRFEKWVWFKLNQYGMFWVDVILTRKHGLP